VSVLLALLLLVACEGSTFPTHAPAAGDRAQRKAELADTTMPAAQRGELVGRVVDSVAALGGKARASFGVCRTPPGFQLLAQSDSVDVLVSLALPVDSVGVGEYLVADLADTTEVSRRASVGAQRLQIVDVAYRAVAGAVWLDRLGRVASGRLDVTLKEVTTDREVRYLAVFERIPVDTLEAAACRPAVADSVRRAPGHGPA
jgi:hypothetical protein